PIRTIRSDGARTTARAISESGIALAAVYRTSFVGRRRERALLTSMFQDALAGRGGLALLAGSAGVGKTRLAREIAADAARRGMQVLPGACYDRDSPLPFGA